MSLRDKFNIKKTWQDLQEEETKAESGGDVEIVNREDPKHYAIFDRLALPISKLVQPESGEHFETAYKIGDEFTRTLFIHTYPHQVEDNWLREILRFEHPIDVAIYVQPLPTSPFLKKMRQRISRDEAAIRKQEEDGYEVDHRRVARLEDTREFVRAIQQDITRPYQIMVALTLRATSSKELDKVSNDLESRLTSVTTRNARWRHKQGFESTLPLMQNNLADVEAVRSMHTQGLMAMFPFSSSELSHASGVLMGRNRATGSPIIINRFMQPEVKSPNTAILGATGSGKSFFAKLEQLRWLYHGVPVMVIDPSGEYRRVCEGVGGNNITISLDSKETINPLDFSNAVHPSINALQNKIAFVVELIGVMMRSADGGVPMDAVTKNLIDNALQETYRRWGYTIDDHSGQLAATAEHMPRLSDLYKMLVRIQRVNDNELVQQRLQPLVAAMTSFVGDGMLAPLFDNHTTINARSHFLNFDYSRLPQEYLPLAMHLVLEFIRTSFYTQQQAESGQHRLLYIDEAQILMHNTETSHFIEHLARTSRKYGIGLTVMTQDVRVFVLNDDGSENKVGMGVLANCTIKVLLKQEASEQEAIRRAFNVSTGEVMRLMSAAAGEGVIQVGQESAWFSAHNMASELEYRMLTTTMSERAQLADGERQAQLDQASGQRGYVDSSHQLESGGGPEAPAPSGYEDPESDSPFEF